jgi:hypothetical protein
MRDMGLYSYVTPPLLAVSASANTQPRAGSDRNARSPSYLSSAPLLGLLQCRAQRRGIRVPPLRARDGLAGRGCLLVSEALLALLVPRLKLAHVGLELQEDLMSGVEVFGGCGGQLVGKVPGCSERWL